MPKHLIAICHLSDDMQIKLRGVVLCKMHKCMHARTHTHTHTHTPQQQQQKYDMNVVDETWRPAQKLPVPFFRSVV